MEENVENEDAGYVQGSAETPGKAQNISQVENFLILALHLSCLELETQRALGWEDKGFVSGFGGLGAQWGHFVGPGACCPEACQSMSGRLNHGLPFCLIPWK